MKWSEAYATGVAAIDDQHKMIFKMAEDFRAALDEGRGQRVYDGFLASLDLYARTHFRFEEDCMERYRCPIAQKNKQAHTKFVEMLGRFQHRYTADGFDRGDARDFVNIIDEWLADHICRIDLQIKDHIVNP